MTTEETYLQQYRKGETRLSYEDWVVEYKKKKSTDDSDYQKPKQHPDTNLEGAGSGPDTVIIK